MTFYITGNGLVSEELPGDTLSLFLNIIAMINRNKINDDYSNIIEIAESGDEDKVSWFLDGNLIGTGYYYDPSSQNCRVLAPLSAVFVLNGEIEEVNIHCSIGGLEPISGN